MEHLLQDVDAIVAWHNVVGADGVLCAASESVTQIAGGHYAPRAVDHIPYTTDVRTFVMTDYPERIQKQLAYRSAVSGMTFTPISSTSDLHAYGVRRALFLPYIRLTDVPLDPAIEWVRYGLPPELTQHLKHKANMHHWLQREGFHNHTMNYVACDIEDIPAVGQQMLDKIGRMYRELGVLDYPLGLMVRGTQTDGNYGAGSLFSKDGMLVLRRNGKAPLIDMLSWEVALEELRDHIIETTNTDLASQVVITRLIDVDVSPGMSAIYENGTLHCFDFNGQYTAPDSTACTGTTTFAFEVGDRAEAYRNAFLPQTQTLLRDIMGRLLAGRDDVAQINGMLNIDMMSVGPREAALWEAAANTPYRDNIGRSNDDYQPRPYDPQYGLFAEINPRETNWTLAMKAVLQAQEMPVTVENLHQLARGENLQVLARDHWELPDNISFDALRENLRYQADTLRPQGEGVILRMPDRPAGLIAYTRDTDPARLESLLSEVQQRLPQG